MSRRMRMHPKNIYKNPVNYKELAIAYPEFRQYVKQELSGQMSIDYFDPKAVKALTQTLLKKDFNLNVNIDETRLIPRVPLCLNYILWVEDLLNCLPKKYNYSGIDLGTGHVSIYSLLCARKGWNMLATEADSTNFKSAENNIECNDLKNQITVKFVSNPDHLLLNVLDDNVNYDFCVCNPPFFDVKEKPNNRTLRQPHFKSVSSQINTEISTSGGEISFITKLIQESQQLKEKVKIYTTLVGKKCDLINLKQELNKAEPKSVCFTEFYQGRTMRWGMAWTYINISLNNCSNSKKKKKRKTKNLLHIILPLNETSTLNKFCEEVKNILLNLEITFKEELKNSGFVVTFKAHKNTWSHQRRKKRLKARLFEKEDHTSSEIEADLNFKNESNDDCSNAKKIKLEEQEGNTEEKTNINLGFVEGIISIKEENCVAIFEMSWLSGNKEYLHQIFQYFKNYWNANV